MKLCNAELMKKVKLLEQTKNDILAEERRIVAKRKISGQLYNELDNLRKKFPRAKIINLSATPSQADGKVMEGDEVYSTRITRIERIFLWFSRVNPQNPRLIHLYLCEM